MEGKKKVKMYALIFLFTAILFAAIGQILMKHGLNSVGGVSLSGLFANGVFTNYYVLGGIFLYFLSLFAWLTALSRLDVSYMYPLVSIGYVLTALFALIFLKENITLFRWIGIFFIVVGSIFMIKS